MTHDHHTHPLISIIGGSAFSLVIYLQENHILDNFLAVFKVIIFGVIGGASGYIGRELTIRIIRKLKKK